MDRPIRVLQVVPLGTGGITSFVLNVIDKTDRTKVTFDYLTFSSKKEFKEDIALSYGGKKYVIPMDRYKNSVIRAVFKFFYGIKVIRQSKADIIHINASFPYDITVAISARLAGVKKVYFHSHNSSMARKGLKGFIIKSFAALIPFVSTKNFACSALAAEFMFPKSIIEKNKYTVINNGIDVSKYGFSQSVREEYRQKLNVTDEILFGHIGRFEKQKNHKFLIDIFEEIHKKNSNTKLLLIGIGPFMEDVKEYAEKKGLTDFVNFYGSTQEVPALLQAMDCFLLPSLFEGLPVVGVEVQASGLPIFMSDTITKEVAITDLAHYFPLDMPAKDWANEILSTFAALPPRRNYHAEVKAAGFDICDVAKKMTEYYKN